MSTSNDQPQPQYEVVRKLQPKALVIWALILVVAIVIATNIFSKEDSKEKQSVTQTSFVTVKYEAFKEVAVGGILPTPSTSELKISTTFVTQSGIEQHDYIEALKSQAGDKYATYRFKEGSPVSLSVQDTGGRGTVTCRISVDGIVISKNTSSSKYGIASCSGIAR